MNFLLPFVTLFRLANFLGTTMLVAQVGWWCYKKYKELSSQKLRACEIRERFLDEFHEQFERYPTDEELHVAMRAADAVDRPLQHQMKNFFRNINISK